MKKLFTVVVGLGVAASVGCAAQQTPSSPASSAGLAQWTLTNPGAGQPVTGATLTVYLTPELDREGKDLITKAEGFKSVELYKLATDTAPFATATLTSTESAKINLLGLKTMADYFLVFNGDKTAMVPTRIIDPAQPIRQYVGARMQRTVIGDLNDPTFQIKVYSKYTTDFYDGKHAEEKGRGIVKFSDGTAIADTYGYFVSWPKSEPWGSDWAVLGTGKRLGYKLGGEHHDVNYMGWINGDNNHGKIQMGAKVTCNTSSCHGDSKSLDFAATSSINASGSLVWDKYSSSNLSGWYGTSKNVGFCFKCHYGPDGDRTGLVDPNQ